MCIKQKTDGRDKTRRPLSAYNYFYKHQRVKILNEIFEAGASGSDSPEKKSEMKIDELFRDYAQKRQRHQKSHGLIPMQSLTKIIASRWEKAGPEARKYYLNLAETDLIRYHNALLTNGTVKSSFYAQKKRSRGNKCAILTKTIVDKVGITWSMDEVEALQEIFLPKA